MSVPRQHDRIFLVGFMGCGKSSVGQHLARATGFRFVDLDRECERAAGMSVEAIFAGQGEVEFRRLEAIALKRSMEWSRVVVATGGGTLTRRENRDLILSHGTMVWLDAPLDVMLARCRRGERRPLLGDRGSMAALLARRMMDYRCADLRIPAEDGTPVELAARIASRLAGM